MSPSEKILVLDIEADSLDTNQADVKVVGVWDNQSNKIRYIWKENLDVLRKAIKKADFVITFNGKRYDFPVLMNDRNKLFKYESTFSRKHIDLYPIVKDRAALFKKKFQDGFGLDAVCKTLGLGEKVSDFDYKILQKDEFTPEEKKEIEHYLHQDVTLTKDLYLFLEEFFEAFKEFLPQKSIDKKHYITVTTGSLAYKAVCHMAGLEEKYRESSEESDTESYKGGDVLGPYLPDARGEIRCVDFTSAYPHAYMQANLYTHCMYRKSGECPNDGADPERCSYRYTGGTTRDGHTLELFGAYCTKNGMGVIERVIQKLFLMRLDAKAELKALRISIKGISNPDNAVLERISYLDKYQQALKIVINTIYGISGSDRFIQVFDIDTAQDCTKICRFNLNYMHHRLKEEGYTLLYGDTDSAYILMPFPREPTEEERKELNTKLKATLTSIIETLKEIFPFPQNTFGIDIDDEIIYAQYFKDGEGGYKKKKYILLQRNGKVQVKGLQVIRSDSSLLARAVWNEKVIEHIQTEKNAIVPRTQIEGWISELIEEDISLVGIEFKVRPFEYYKNPSQIQAQIAKELGEGRHFMVRTKGSIGIGKNVKYVHIDEAKNMDLNMIDVSRAYSDLSDLTLDTQTDFMSWTLTEDEVESLSSQTTVMKAKSKHRR